MAVGESKDNVALEDILETFGSQNPKQQGQLDRRLVHVFVKIRI